MLVLRWAALCAELASTHSLDPLAVWAEHTATQTPASDAPNPTGLGGWRYYFRPEDEAAIYPARLLGLEEGETVTVMGTPALKIEVEGGVSIPPQPSAADLWQSSFQGVLEQPEVIVPTSSSATA